MAVTIDRAGLLNALRLTDSQQITSEINRLLEYATLEINRVAPNAPDAVSNQAAVQLVSFLFENPGAIPGRALRLSGASGTLAGYFAAPEAGLIVPGQPGGLTLSQVNALIETHDAENQRQFTALDGRVTAANTLAAQSLQLERAHEATTHNTDAAARARLDTIEADDWVTGRRIAAKTVASGNLVDNVIDQERLIADNVIETQHIRAGAVTEAEMAGAVTTKIDRADAHAQSDHSMAGADATARQAAATAAAAAAAAMAQQEIDAHETTTHNTDATARAAAATADGKAVAAAAAAATADGKAVAAQLDADTVITISPSFTVGETAARNINVDIRHPLNAYRPANILSVNIGGQTPVLVTYNPGVLHQSLDAGISAQTLSNLSSQLVAGGFIQVEIRLQEGRAGRVHFVRQISVPVDPAPAAPAAPTLTIKQQLGLYTRVSPVAIVTTAAAKATALTNTRISVIFSNADVVSSEVYYAISIGRENARTIAAKRFRPSNNTLAEFISGRTAEVAGNVPVRVTFWTSAGVHSDDTDKITDWLFFIPVLEVG